MPEANDNNAGAGAGAQPKTIDQWREALPADLGGHAGLAKFNGKDFSEVVKSYLNLESKLGANPIVRPKDDAPDTDWAGFYTALGRPENPDGYAFDAPGELPEGFKVPDGYEQTFKAAAHGAGLSVKQANALWKHQLGQMAGGYKSTLETYNNRVGEAHAALKKEWGAAYDTKLSEANRAALALGGQDLVAWLKQSGAGREAPLIKAFAEVAKFVKEDTLGEGSRRSVALSPAEAQSEINTILGDKKHPYHDRKHPGHRDAVMQVKRLFEMSTAKPSQQHT